MQYVIQNKTTYVGKRTNVLPFPLVQVSQFLTDFTNLGQFFTIDNKNYVRQLKRSHTTEEKGRELDQASIGL